ncbi:MAG: hypothetical protein KKG04_02645 [Candidatus Thermoplasmatota archaeon]|nr:hypothetical protein [Candidatus Thermoplasmatota archaeon]
MKADTDWKESKAKERIGLNFVTTILELAGYEIMQFGIENHNMSIVRKIKGNYETETNQRIMCMPDYVVVDPDTKKTELVEVKYRTVPRYFSWKDSSFLFGYRTIHNYLDYWKDLTLVITINVEPYCLCIRMKDVDWSYHFREKKETTNGKLDEVWNFSGIYKSIKDVFPRVKDEHFTKACKINKFD